MHMMLCSSFSGSNTRGVTNSKPEEDLAIPTNEAQAVTSMRPTEETKRINVGFTDERKTAIISSSLYDK
jgi:hypothetical protein